MDIDKIGTKQKLLAVATELFGRLGKETVSIRMIAKAADVNVSAISYYFNGKDSLYMECVKALVKAKQQQMKGVFNAIQKQLENNKNEAQAFKELLADLISSLLTVFIKTGSITDRNIILREIISPTKAYDIIRSKLFDTMHEQMAQLIYLANGSKITSIEAQIRTTAVLGFIRSISMPDDKLLKNLGIDDLDETSKKILTQHILTLAV